jgi:diguanylate cyclase (GGDEF)-like protein
LQSLHLVFIVIVIQQGFFALMWCLLASLRMARSASLHWGAASVVTALGMAAVLVRPHMAEHWPPMVGWALPNVLSLLAFVLVHRGVVRFARLPGRDAEHLWTLLLGVVAIGSLPLVDARGYVWLVAATAFNAVPILRTAWIIRHALAPEFGVVAARGVAVAVAVLAGFLIFRTLAVVLHGAPVLINDAGGANVVVALAYLTLGLVLSFTLGTLVVLRLVFKLRHLSHHDPLTQLLNRRGLERALQVERQRLARHKRPFALLALDLDHFKAINDQHGHEAGDAALVQVAALLREQARSGDLTARTGGEEFVILLPDTHAEGARHAAERLMQAMRTRSIVVNGTTLQITTSVGIALATDAREDLLNLARRLDRALYRAKNEGRDRAVLAEAFNAAS